MLTTQQATAVDALLNTTSHLALVARAGTGKTYTIIEMVVAYLKKFPQAEMLVAAYNAPIAAEVGGKIEKLGLDWRRVSASTAHSLGFGLVKFRFKLDRKNINDHKVRDIVRAMENSSEDARECGTQIINLVSKAKQAGVGFFDNAQIGSKDVWYDLAERFNINDFDDTSTLDRVVVLAQEVYRRSLNDVTQVDFDDMILFPLIKNIHVKFTKDVLLVDEYQDISRARAALLRKFVKPGTGRMVLVGDDRQSIYAFSGADPEAMFRDIAELSATVLPLNVTWRCPKAVVRLAQTLVPDFTAADEAPEGLVDDCVVLPGDLKAGDAILCRNTAPLVETAYKLIKAHIPCKVEGKDIGAGLVRLAQRWKVTTTDALLKKLDIYETREIQKAIAKGKEDRIDSITDQVGSLRFIIGELNAAGHTHVSDVIRFCDEMFGENVTGVVVLCSYHRSKGREWFRVFLIEHYLRCPSKWAKKDYERLQEENLAYVAWTRAKADRDHPETTGQLWFYDPDGTEIEVRKAL